MRLIALLLVGIALTVSSCAGSPGTRPHEDDGWRLVVLGVAQDGGLPHLGCVRPRCEAARLGVRRSEKVASVGLTDGKRLYLIDATPDLPAQVHAQGVRVPDGIFLTHAHIGHYTGLMFLGKAVLGARGVPVWATTRMAGFLRENGPWSALVADGNIDLREGAAAELGPIRVTSFPVPHRDEFSDTVGYRIEGPRSTVLYIPDIDRWEKWDRDLNSLVRGVDYAFLDGTFYSLLELPHRDIEKVRHPLVTETMDRLEGQGEKVWFLHLNHSNPIWDDPSPVESRGFHIAREGMSLPL